jgi:hypothetical protein
MDCNPSLLFCYSAIHLFRTELLNLWIAIHRCFSATQLFVCVEHRSWTYGLLPIAAFLLLNYADWFTKRFVWLFYNPYVFFIFMVIYLLLYDSCLYFTSIFFMSPEVARHSLWTNLRPGQESWKTSIRGLFEKLTVPELVKNFSAFYGNQRFISVLITAHRLSVLCAWSV